MELAGGFGGVRLAGRHGREARHRLRVSWSMVTSGNVRHVSTAELASFAGRSARMMTFGIPEELRRHSPESRFPANCSSRLKRSILAWATSVRGDSDRPGDLDV